MLKGIMKAKYWLCKRNNVFFSFDSANGQRLSLHTRDREEAQRILRAKNDAATQPAINISIAKAYLVGTDPKLVARTWGDAIKHYCSKQKETTRVRMEREYNKPVYNLIRDRKLVETTADDFNAVLQASGAFTLHMLRCLHNLALGLGWILTPIIPPRLWPKHEKKPKRAVTWEEHQRIVQREPNLERKNYYELLWEIGSAQTDGANMKAENIDWKKRLLSYHRQKTGELCQLAIGPRLEALLKSLPTEGALFPTVTKLGDNDRATKFRDRCQRLLIVGISLHSYRYAWAERAKELGMPERFAQSALGHASLAVHRHYSRDGAAICPSLENFEGKIVPALTTETPMAAAC
jgi:hypothetical protein